MGLLRRSMCFKISFLMVHLLNTAFSSPFTWLISRTISSIQNNSVQIYSKLLPSSKLLMLKLLFSVAVSIVAEFSVKLSIRKSSLLSVSTKFSVTISYELPLKLQKLPVLVCLELVEIFPVLMGVLGFWVRYEQVMHFVGSCRMVPSYDLSLSDPGLSLPS